MPAKPTKATENQDMTEVNICDRFFLNMKLSHDNIFKEKQYINVWLTWIISRILIYLSSLGKIKFINMGSLDEIVTTTVAPNTTVVEIFSELLLTKYYRTIIY